MKLRSFGPFHFLLQVEEDEIEELSSSSQVNYFLTSAEIYIFLLVTFTCINVADFFVLFNYLRFM